MKNLETRKFVFSVWINRILSVTAKYKLLSYYNFIITQYLIGNINYKPWWYSLKNYYIKKIKSINCNYICIYTYSIYTIVIIYFIVYH